MNFNNKITCITIFDENSLDKIKKCIGEVEFNLCKLKYDEEDRETKDLLPSHSTICVWKNRETGEIKKLINSINFCEFKMKIIGTEIKESTQNSYNLYFKIKGNEELIKIQELIYQNKQFRVEKYKPHIFIPHITIHIDKDLNKILKLQERIMQNFKPFEVNVCKLGLYSIYPPEKLI